MGAPRQQGIPSEFSTQQLPIIGQYGVQRFKQWSPEDAANWVVQKGNEGTKRPYSMYPAMGRAHISYRGNNVLIFTAEPRGHFKTLSYWYEVVGNQIYRFDRNYTQVNIGKVESPAGNIFFAFLVVNTIVFACFVDEQFIYIYREDTNLFSKVTDINAPGNSSTTDSNGNIVHTKPGYIVAFGNRIAVSVAGSSQFVLSETNLLTSNQTGKSAFEPNYCFTIGTVLTAPGGSVVVQGSPVFAQEDGTIQQMGVLNNKLYIFCDYVTGIWSNIAARFDATGVYFPWKKSSSYNWNFGIADPLSLDIDFGIMAFLAQNSDGLLQPMICTQDQPEPIASKAIDVLFQRYSNNLSNNSPFLAGNALGFLYQYENTIFYRLSGGPYTGTGLLDQEQMGNSIEYNFDTKTWHRCIELNGERCRIQRHIFFNNQHLVTVLGDNTVYQMSGQFYYNEVQNPAEPDQQAPDAYLQYPFRYERVTPIISNPDYSEFETDYVEIDFVFGDSNINYSDSPFANAQFIIDEQADSSGNPQFVVAENLDLDGQPIFMITEQGNTPSLNDLTYNALFKPSIELFWSDDGGISFSSASVLEFAQMGVYQWRMRWYQLGPSRNRAYKLIAVSPVPIVILGGVMMVRRLSGGAN